MPSDGGVTKGLLSLQDPTGPDDGLLESPVSTILDALLSKWKPDNGSQDLTGGNHNKQSDYIICTLLPRVDDFINTTLIKDPRLTTVLQAHSVHKKGQQDTSPLNLISAFREYLHRIDPPGIITKNNRHYTQMDVATMLGLGDLSPSPSSPINFVNTILGDIPNAKPSGRKGKTADDPGADSASDVNDNDENPYWAVDHVRSLMAHCLSYEHHIGPHLGKLREKCEALRSDGSKRTHLVSLYARHMAALHSVLQVHRAAADRIGNDLVHFMIPESGSKEIVPPEDIYQMSRELRDQVPSLRMPSDAYPEGAWKLRARHSHLSTLYEIVHGALCQLAFQTEIPVDDNVPRPPAELLHILRVIGNDTDIAKSVKSTSATMTAILKWAEGLHRSYNRRPEEFSDIGLVSQIVSVLQDSCKIFPNICMNYVGIRDEFVKMVQVQIETVVPKKAQEELANLLPGVILRSSRFTLDVAGALLRSPLSEAQADGLRAIALYVGPFAKRHFRMHLEMEKHIEEEQIRWQQARLGKAFQHYLRPYDRPGDSPIDNAKAEHRNLSLFHLGPLPPNKGLDVQTQADRGAVNAGSVGSMYPLVVVVGPSGVGKSDLLEQMSKHRTGDCGSLTSNYAEILLPLNFRHVMDRVTKSNDMRDELRRRTLMHILSQMIVATALLDGDGQAEHPEDLPSATSEHPEDALLPTPHDLFRFFNNGGGDFVNQLSTMLHDINIHINSSMVTLSRTLLLEAAKKTAYSRTSAPQIHARLSFAVDEVNALADTFRNKVRKSDEAAVNGDKSGSMLTVVANTLQMVGTSIYAGTGLRYSLLEETISALGKEIIVMAPSFPPTTYRTIVYVLHRLLGFKNLKGGRGTTAMQSIEVPMLCGRMRFVELFMLELLKERTEVPLSEQANPEHTFCAAMVEVAKLMTNDVTKMMSDLQKSKALHCALELASCGVMRVDANPGDPQNADNILVRCGLVQLDDNKAYISGRRGDESDVTEGASPYLFLNREPMIQYALSEVIFEGAKIPGLNTEQHFTMLEEHIWVEHISGGDSSRNGVEMLGWLLLRAMSKDSALHNLLTGAGSDSQLAEYANETTFVWCDAPGGFPPSYPPWIEQHEKEHNVGFKGFLQEKYGVAQKHLEGCVEDMWFHVAHLDHSDSCHVRFLSRVAVTPPRDIGADIISSWRHKSNPKETPLLVLVACTERDDDCKLQDDANNTFPSMMGSRFNVNEKKVIESKLSKLNGPLYHRRALRILLHPNVIPGGNMDIAKLANLYGLSKEVVRQGHGRDDQENFIALINRTTLQRAIDELGGKCGSFGNMVLRLWKRYFEDERRSKFAEKGNSWNAIPTASAAVETDTIPQGSSSSSSSAVVNFDQYRDPKMSELPANTGTSVSERAAHLGTQEEAEEQCGAQKAAERRGAQEEADQERVDQGPSLPSSQHPSTTQDPYVDNEDVILRLRGKEFTITLGTLKNGRSTYFKDLMDTGDYQKMLNIEGQIVLLRNPKHFELILDFICGNEEHVLDDIREEEWNSRDLKSLRAEVEFYGIQELINAVEKRLDSMKEQQPK